MTRNDINVEIKSILKIKPSDPKQMIDELKRKGIVFSNSTFFRSLRRLNGEGIIRKIPKEEALSRGYDFPTGKEQYYQLQDNVIEDRKKIFLNFLKNNNNIITEKNVKIILKEFENYMEYFYKIEEYQIFLNFYNTIKKIFENKPYLEESIISKYPADFIGMANKISKLYNEKKNLNKNPYKDLYENVIKITKSLFTDYLNMFKKNDKIIDAKIIFPICDLMYKLNILPPIEEFLELLLTEKNLLLITEDLMIKYISYSENELEHNLEYIKKQSCSAYLKYLKNNSEKYYNLMKTCDEIIEYFKIKMVV